MPFNFADAKAQMRRVVHDTFAVSALYQDSSVVTPVAISARYHNKMTLKGDLDNTGYAEVIEGIDRIILRSDDLTTAGITARPKGVVTLVPYNASYRLVTKVPSDGPVEEEVWEVARV